MDVEPAAELTDPRLALEALRASEARFRAAFEENPETIGIYRPVLDADGRFVDAEVLYENRIGRMRYYGGLPLDAIVGSMQFERWPQSRPLLFDLFAGFVEQGHPTSAKLHGIRADGEYWAEVSLFPFEGGFVLVGRDVTASVLARREAQELDTRYRSVLDAMLDGVAIMEPVRDESGAIIDLRCRYLNQAAVSGAATVEALVGTRLLELWPEAATNGLFDALVAVFQGGPPLTLDGVAFSDPSRPDDPTRLLDLRINRVGDTAVATWRDVTEQRRTADALAASEARYAQLVDGITIGVFVARDSADGRPRFEYVSRQCARILGAEAAAITRDANVVLARLHPDDLGRMEAETVRSRRERSRFHWEGRIRVDGRDRVLRVVSMPSEPHPGGPLTWLGIIEDITEQRRTAESLRQSEERYRVLADNANDVIWTMDPTGRITFVSPAIERVRGITPEAATRQSIEEIHPPSSREVSRAYMVQLLDDLAAGREPRPFVGELEYFHAAGGTVWCEVRVIPQVDAEGRLVELIGVSRDITERRRHEEQLRGFSEELEGRVAERTRELEAANEELRSFSYSVSHDLRAPVRAVAGFARILQRDLGAQLDADALHKLDNIRVAGETMGRLIDDLLAYTRIGQGAIHDDAVPLGPVVEGIRIVLGARLAESGGTLELGEPAAVPLADRSLLDRVLLNLVDNALAYRRPGVPPRIRIGASERDGEVTISVSDNGIGIPQEAWERIFEVFTRLDPGGDQAKSGIGLATVRKAVRAMGSEVTLDSVVGEGTTFRFTLPAAPAG